VRILVGRDALVPPVGGSAVTIGTFDGVHLGHRALMARAIADAAGFGGASVVLTWDRHPAATLRPDRVPPLLASPERKVELIEEMGVDVLAVLPFDEELSHQAPEAFVGDVLVKGLGAGAVIVGHDWRFGHRAKGDVDLLAQLGRELGFEVAGAELQEVGGEPVSSSRVRRVVAAGDMESARDLLGRPFDVDGVVVRGAARGKGLGFPTANLEVDPQLARPPRGVYAGVAHLAGRAYAAAVNVGVNPTFGGEVDTSPLLIEAYILDFESDIYGEVVRLEFWSRLRDELRFDSVQDLVTQMGADVEATRRLVPL